MKEQHSLASIIRKNESELLAEWSKEQVSRQTRRKAQSGSPKRPTLE